MENISSGENEKSLEILGAEALAELDDKTRAQTVTFVSFYLNRIYGNCIWVGVLYALRMFSNSNSEKQKKNQIDLLELIADIIQLFAFLFFPLQNLYYWGILKETYRETRLGEVMNFGRAHKVAVVYTVSFFLAVGIWGSMFLLSVSVVNDVEEENRTLSEIRAERANESAYAWHYITNPDFVGLVDNKGELLNYDVFMNYAEQGIIDKETGRRTKKGEELYGKAPEPIKKKDVTSGENAAVVWFWRIAEYSFYFSVIVLLWSFFVAYTNRLAFKNIVEHYGDEELIDIVEEQYSIRNALFTRETLLSKLR